MGDFKSHAGINISANKLQLLEVKKEKEHSEIININESYFNEQLDFSIEKNTSLSSALQTAFDDIQLKQPITSSLVSFSLPQEIFYTVQLPYETSLSQKELIEEFRWELSLLYPFVPLEELIVQYVKMDRNSINKKNTALVIAIEKKHIKLIKNFCIKNNLSLRYVDSSMIAANRLFNSMEELTSKGLTLNILTVSNSFSFTLNVSRKPAYVRIFQVAKNKKVSDILADELNSSNLKNIKTELANEAYISGDGITAELISQLRIATGLNFKQLNPFKDSKVKQDLKNGNLIDEKYSSFTSAAGIAFRLI